MRFRWLSILVLVASHAAAAPTIESRQVGDNDFELTLHSEEILYAGAGQRALQPAAAALCKDKPAQFGHYAFESAEPIAGSKEGTHSKLLLRQQIHCGMEATSIPMSTPGWRPAPADEAMLTQYTYDYFRAKDEHRYTDAYRYFMPGIFEFEGWRSASDSQAKLRGGVRSRSVRKVTWYIDPPGTPGIFAAVDYSGDFEGLAFLCGYVVWRRQPNGAFLLIREEENAMPKDIPQQVQQSVRAKFGC